MAPGGLLIAAGNLVGLGIDAVDIGRFATVLARRPAVAERLFSAAERQWAAGLANPSPSLAARFAAKEAVMKALGVGIGAFAFAEVEIRRLPSGRPQVALSGRAAAVAAEYGARAWQLSMTHTDALASAVAAALS